ncbi:MAG: class I SAM-dependent methyltransferase, partial [Clostridiales bacterium]|nr:class I SAM-dependent methyltransferase [Clostridiales bacterium]
MSGYSALYRYYDFLMKDYDYDGIFAFLTLCFDKNMKKGFEFACGTGKMTDKLAEAGFEMTASDISEEMLNIAVERASARGQKTIFLRQDINRPELNKKYDFIVSFTDGVNYISSQKKFNRFLNIANESLNGGGRLIFDMSSYYKAENKLSEKMYFEDGENLTFFWQNGKLSKKSGKINMRLTFFEEKNGVYHRYDESNAQYFYKNRNVEKLLADNGFEAELYDARTLKRAGLKSERVLVSAIKK